MSFHRVLFAVALGCLVGMGGCGEGPGTTGGTGGSGATGGNRGPGPTGGTGGSGPTGGTGGSGATGGTAAVPKCIDLEDFPNGVAAGDVDQSSVVLWARASSAGTVRFEYGTDPDFVEPPDGFVDVEVETYVDRETKDETTIPSKAEVTGLLDGTRYYYRACRDSCPSTSAPGCKAPGSFRTPHAATDGDHGLSFGVSSCFRGDLRPFDAIKNVPEQDLDFFVALGDTAYADSPLTCGHGEHTIDKFRCRHREVYSAKTSQDDNMFARARASTAFFATIDDHEVENNFAGGDCDGEFENCYNDSVLFENGLQAFVDYNPLRDERYERSTLPRDRVWSEERKLYRYRAFGKDAALFMLDARSFRDGDGDSMLGYPQLEDLKKDLRDAENRGITWKFVLVPEPIQHLGLPGADDRYEGYGSERAEILRFIDSNCLTNVVFISGDIHGTVANNLVYDGGTYSASWDISTGPVAYHKPLGPTVLDPTGDVWYQDFFASAVGKLVRNRCEIDLSEYNNASRLTKDTQFMGCLDAILTIRNNSGIGVDSKFEHPRTGLVPEHTENLNLVQGQYVLAHTLGWTQFEIDAGTQKLTVTTYGMDPASPSIVSQFEVDAVAVRDGGSCPWFTLGKPGDGVTEFGMESFGGPLRIYEIRHGALRIKDGVDEDWIDGITSGALSQVELKGEVIAVLHEDGRFHAKAGAATNRIWSDQTPRSTGVTEFRIESIGAGVRIAALDNGSWYVKDSILTPPDATWYRLSHGQPVEQIQLKGDYIGLLFEDGLFRVKKGADNDVWTTVGDVGEGVTEFGMELNGDDVRIYEIRDGALRVKDGIHETPHVLSAAGEHGGVRQVELKGEVIAVLHENGLFRVKVGAATDPDWITLGKAGEGVTEFGIESLGGGIRIYEIRNGGLRVKNGINGKLARLPDRGAVRQIQLEGPSIGLLLDDGLFRVTPELPPEAFE